MKNANPGANPSKINYNQKQANAIDVLFLYWFSIGQDYVPGLSYRFISTFL